MSEPRICAVSAFDKNYWPVAQYSVLSIERSLLETGIPLVLSNPAGQEGRPAAWSKIPAIQQRFREGWDYVIWLDADCLLTRAVPWKELIGPGKDIHLVRHRDASGREVPNLGVGIYRNSPYTQWILEQIWNLEYYIHHKWWENAAFIDLFSPEDFTGEGIRADRTVHSDERISWLPLLYNSIPLGHGYQAADPAIVHFAGISQLERTGKMRDLYESAWGS